MLVAYLASTTMYLSTYTFKWKVPGHEISYSIEADSWPSAFDRAMTYCEGAVDKLDSTKDLSRDVKIDLCASPMR